MGNRPSREPMWRRYARFLRPDVAADVDDEVAFHLEMRTREFEARGMARPEAERAARQRFGDVERIQQWLRNHDMARYGTFQRREVRTMILQRLHLALRSLVRAPTFGAAAVLVLAFGIGATTAIVAVVQGVLLDPLPYPDADRLVAIQHTTPAVPGNVFVGQSHAGYETYKRLGHAFEDVGLHVIAATSISDGVSAERVNADSITASVFSTLRVGAMLGRVFGTADERPGHAPVVVISERLWRRRFGGDSALLGRTLRVDGRAHEVVGVAPAGIQYPDPTIDVWLPLGLAPDDPIPANFHYESVARLRPGVTIEAATRELNALVPRTAEFFPAALPGTPMPQFLALARPQVHVRPLREELVGDVGRVLWVVLGTIGFVLLAACTNVATLFVVRAEGRQRELAVRAALGAGRWDAAGGFLAEGFVVASLGAVLGVAIAHAALGALRQATDIPLPRLSEVRIDATVLLVTSALTLVVTLLASAFPILRFGRRDLAPTLRAGGRGLTSGRDRRRVQGGLVMTQVALACMLLASSALMARTFNELRNVRPGFEVDRRLSFHVALPTATYASDTALMQLYDRVTAGMAAVPGVRSVGLTSWVPLDRDARSEATFFPEGATVPAGELPPAVDLVRASPPYFDTMGIPLLAGRSFRHTAPDDPSDEVIVSGALASQAWGQAPESAVGRRARFMPDGRWMTVVGVVGEVRQRGLERGAAPIAYLPLNSGAYPFPSTPSSVGVVVTTAAEPATLMEATRRAIAGIDPAIPVYHLRPLQDLLARSMARTSITALMLALAAAVALALGAIGLYGLVSCSVGMRRHEIGLRLALGESPASVIRRFAREGTRLAMAGVCLGMVGTVLVSRTLRGLLFGVAPNDPAVLGVATAILVLTAWLASWIPARRAARLDPSRVLTGN